MNNSTGLYYTFLMWRLSNSSRTSTGPRLGHELALDGVCIVNTANSDAECESSEL